MGKVAWLLLVSIGGDALLYTPWASDIRSREVGDSRSAIPNCKVVSSWAWNLDPKITRPSVLALDFLACLPGPEPTPQRQEVLPYLILPAKIKRLPGKPLWRAPNARGTNKIKKKTNSENCKVPDRLTLLFTRWASVRHINDAPRSLPLSPCFTRSAALPAIERVIAKSHW